MKGAVPSPGEEPCSTWGWSAAKVNSNSRFSTSVLILGRNGRKPLFYILFWQIAILCGFTVRLCVVLFFFFKYIYFPFDVLRNTSWKHSKTTAKPEDLAKLSNISSIWNQCHGSIHLHSDTLLRQDAFGLDVSYRWPWARLRRSPGQVAGSPAGQAGRCAGNLRGWHLVNDDFLCSWLSFLPPGTLRDVLDTHSHLSWLIALGLRLSHLCSLITAERTEFPSVLLLGLVYSWCMCIFSSHSQSKHSITVTWVYLLLASLVYHQLSLTVITGIGLSHAWSFGIL